MVGRRNRNGNTATVMILAATLLLSTASVSAFRSNTCATTDHQSALAPLHNMLRDIADYSDAGTDPYSRNSERSGASSRNWRKNQGYNLGQPTPPQLGGSFVRMRDAETNPYYDPGWAQSIRRDNPSRNYQSTSSYNGYNDPYTYGPYQNSYQYPSTYPGMTTPIKTARAQDRAYYNPVNPYYDPMWSQSYVEDREPIREGDHTEYYAPGYEYNRQGGYINYGFGGMHGNGMYGYGGGYGRRYYASSVDKSGKKLNGNSFMR